MKERMTAIGLVLLMAMSLLASCGPARPAPGIRAQAGPQAWFDAPLPNSEFFPPNPVVLVMHASDAQGIASFELSSNGARAADIPSPDTSESLVTLSYEWQPPGPGRYVMTVRARNNVGAWSPYAETVVIVPALERAPTDVVPVESPTPTETALIQPSPQPPTNTAQPAAISFEGLSTSVVYFRGNGCGPKEVNVQVRATDPLGINVVVLFYQIESKSGNGATGFDSVGMNPVGNDLYQATLNPDSLYGAAALSKYGEAWLDLQAVIQNSAGDTSTRTSVLANTTVAPCGGAEPPPPTATLSLRILPSPTNTPVIVR